MIKKSTFLTFQRKGLSTLIGVALLYSLLTPIFVAHADDAALAKVSPPQVMEANLLDSSTAGRSLPPPIMAPRGSRTNRIEIGVASPPQVMEANWWRL
jgi:hypothetical protein